MVVIAFLCFDTLFILDIFSKFDKNVFKKRAKFLNCIHYCAQVVKIFVSNFFLIFNDFLPGFITNHNSCLLGGRKIS